MKEISNIINPKSAVYFPLVYLFLVLPVGIKIGNYLEKHAKRKAIERGEPPFKDGQLYLKFMKDYL